MNWITRRRRRRLIAEHHARRAEQRTDSVFTADIGAFWVIPPPPRPRPPIPMSREQSRAYKRIQRVAKVRDRWERKRQREMVARLQGYRQRWAQVFDLAALIPEVDWRDPAVPTQTARHHALLAPEVQ